MIKSENDVIEIKGTDLQIGKDLLNIEKIINESKHLKYCYNLAKKTDKIVDELIEDLLKL